MKNLKLIILSFLLGLNFSPAYCVAHLFAFENVIYFDEPDPNIWTQTDFEVDSSKGSIRIVLKHDVIIDEEGRSIIPAISIFYQQYNEPVDLVLHHINKKMAAPVPMEYLASWTYDDRMLRYKNAITFKYSYNYNNFPLYALWSHYGKGNGVLWVSCDATTSVYDLVEEDFLKFIRSIYIRKQDENIELFQLANGTHDPTTRVKMYTSYLKVIEEDPDAFFARGLAYDKLEDKEAALQDYTSAIFYDSTFSAAFSLRGTVYLNMGQLSEAQSDYEMCIFLDSTYTNAHYNLACLFSLKHEARKSLAMLKRAIELGYDNFDHIQKDTDLEFLRNSDGYKAWKYK